MPDVQSTFPTNKMTSRLNRRRDPILSAGVLRLLQEQSSAATCFIGLHITVNKRSIDLSPIR